VDEDPGEDTRRRQAAKARAAREREERVQAALDRLYPNWPRSSTARARRQKTPEPPAPTPRPR
jgi:hypothetical protein